MTNSLWEYPAKFLTLNEENSVDALSDVTDLLILAHPDDAEIVAPDLILACQKDPNRKLGVIIITDGRGAPRIGEFAGYSDQQLADARTLEQAAAAQEGKYHYLAMLQHPDLAKVSIDSKSAAKEIHRIARQCPKLTNVVTHNPFDKHAGHLGVFAAAIIALRMLPDELQQTLSVRGAEVWGEISFLEGSKNLLTIPLSKEELALQEALLGKHRSQTEGAKPYIPAVKGRQAARGTFENPFEENNCENVMLAVDLRDLLKYKNLTIAEFIQHEITLATGRYTARASKLSLSPPTNIEPSATAERALRSLERIRTA